MLRFVLPDYPYAIALFSSATIDTEILSLGFQPVSVIPRVSFAL